MDITQRIAQFENMVKADPTNDMAHFSLGGAYSQAGRHRDAAESYVRCLELNKAMSKAYQLAGAAYIQADDKAAAIRVLTDGYRIAGERGDRMPMSAIGDLLNTLGVTPPKVSPGKGEAASGATTNLGTGDGFVCRRTGRPGTKMERPPFRGPVGEWIAANIATETFQEWLGQGTKVINELRLDLSREQDETVYDQHMREYLGIDEELYTRLMGR